MSAHILIGIPRLLSTYITRFSVPKLFPYLLRADAGSRATQADATVRRRLVVEIKLLAFSTLEV
jgi:hypothetical protein